MQFRHRSSAPFFLVAALCFILSAQALESTQPSLIEEWGKTPAAETRRGYVQLNAGELDLATASFEAALKFDAQDAAALEGLAQIATANNNHQHALELHCQAIASSASKSFLSEFAVESAANLLRFSKDPSPFTKLLEIPNTFPATHGTLLECALEWNLCRGNYDAARKLSSDLNYVNNFMLSGPFDNRDNAGLSIAYEPEKELDFEKDSEGRNRRVGWFPVNAKPLDGRIWLSEIFDPNTHVCVYAATLAHAEADMTVSLRASFAGAMRVWVNNSEVASVKDYNDFGRDKITAPVRLFKGWNLILLKSAIVEDTQWGFALRFGSAKPLGLKFDASVAALAAWREQQKSNPIKSTAAVAPEHEIGLASQLKNRLEKYPNDPQALAMLAATMDFRKMGEKKDSSSDAPSAEKYLRKAIALTPQNPLLKIQLAQTADDNNEARNAADAAFKSHPALPVSNETLALLASKARLHITAEKISRDAWRKLGVEKCGEIPLVLADELSEKGARAEAWEIIKQFVNQFPYHAEARLRLINLEDSIRARRELVLESMKFCGGNHSLIQSHLDNLSRLGKFSEAAQLAQVQLANEPYNLSWVRAASYRCRAAGDRTTSVKIIEDALKNAPENPELLAILAHERHHEGKDSDASALLKKVLAVKPNTPDVKDYLALLDAGKSLDRSFFAPYDVALKDLLVPDTSKYPKDTILRLLNQEVIRVNPNGSASRMVHKISKLLLPAGSREIAQHHIYYEPQLQSVDILRAVVIAPDGRELSRGVIHDRSTSAAMGVETLIYDEHHLKQISFRNIEPGCIVDLQYTIRDNGGSIYGDYFSDSFYFADGHPVLRSEYILDYPKSLTIQTRTQNTTSPLTRLDAKDPNRETMKWELKDIAGIQREYLMPPAVDALPQLQATTMKSWQEVGAWFWNLARDQVIVNEEMRKDIADLTKDSKTNTDKLRAIHDFVIRKIRYLGIEFGRNGYKPHKATETHKALYGDCKDTATLLTAMLTAAGIDCKLVLIRTVDSGAVSPDSLALPNLFNHCIAYVPNVDGKDYWIDGTTDFYRLGEVPAADRSAQVLVAGPEGGQFMKIPQCAATDNKIENIYRVNVSKNGSASLTLRDTRSGQLAPTLRESIETPGKFDSAMKDYAARRFNGAEMKSLKASDPLSQGPAWSEIELAVPKIGTPSGDKLALPSNFEPLSLTQRYAGEPKRKQDIQLYTPWSRHVELHYKLEPGVKAASLPEEAHLETPSGKYIRTVKQTADEILIYELFELPQTRISVKDYEAFKDFCQKVDALIDQKVLLGN